jgi:RNA polymerase sigma-70 factor (ECF subfamily)
MVMMFALGEAVGDPPGGADAGLVVRARSGDRDSFESLYRRHRERVARTAYLLVRDLHLAQDVAQEAFLIGWRDLSRLRDPSLFRAWVTGIAVNLARKVARPPVQVAEGVAEPGGDPDRDIAVRDAIVALPRRLREAVVLRFYGGFTEAEMGAALGIPTGTVKSRLSRARARLNEALRDVAKEEA